MDNIIYFDNNSTTHLLPEIKEKLHEAIDSQLGNPESLDQLGKSAKAIIEESRFNIAALLGTVQSKIIFTSSGSESNAIAIHSAVKNCSRKKIVCSQIEHTSIHKTLEFLALEGYDIKMIKTLPSGIIDIVHAKSLIDNNTALVSVQLVNNETGVIQPVAELAKLSKNAKALFHCDGAQALGKMDFEIEELGCDYFTFTAHKIHGPKGVGGIWVSGKIDRVYPLICGGSQEFGRRGGTQNLLGIIGFGTAAKIRHRNSQKVSEYVKQLRDTFEEKLLEVCPVICINGKESPRICNTSNIQFKEVDGKALFLRLLQNNIVCSQTSACTAQYPEPSKTLRAMGLTYEEAFNSIRFSFSEMNTLQEVFTAVDTISATYIQIKNILGPGW